MPNVNLEKAASLEIQKPSSVWINACSFLTLPNEVAPIYLRNDNRVSKDRSKAGCMNDLERGGSRSIFGVRHYQYQWSIAASMDQAPASSFGHWKCPRYAHQAPPDPQQPGIE